MDEIEHYLSNITAGQRAEFARIRGLELEAAPGAEEIFSYRMPGFALGGKTLIWVGAFKRHMMTSQPCSRESSAACLIGSCWIAAPIGILIPILATSVPGRRWLLGPWTIVCLTPLFAMLCDQVLAGGACARAVCEPRPWLRRALPCVVIVPLLSLWGISTAKAPPTKKKNVTPAR